MTGIVTLLGAAGIGAGAASIIKAAVSMQTLELGLKAVSSSAAEAQVAIERMRDVAKMPGLGFREAIEGFTRLRASGFSAQLSERTLRAFGNALASVGKGKSDLDGVILALSQISAKGKVSAQEINQLGERVFQIRSVMERAFGTANTETLQSMNITPAVFIEQIVNELEKIPRVAAGAQNSIDNLYDALDQARIALGQAFLPMITKAADQIARLFTAMRESGILAAVGQKLADFFSKSLVGIFSGGTITGGVSLFLAILESVPEVLTRILDISKRVFNTIHVMLVNIYNTAGPLFRELFNMAARALNLYSGIRFGLDKFRGKAATYSPVPEIGPFKPASNLWEAMTSGSPGGPLDLGFNIRQRIGRRTEEIIRILSNSSKNTSTLPDWPLGEAVSTASPVVATLGEIAQNTRETAENTRPDLRRYALGGGALGQVGITAVELAGYRAGANKQITVVLQGGRSFEQMLSQAISDTILQMKRQGAF